VANAGWPEVDPALLVEDEVTIAVQVKGKLRDTLTVAKGLPQPELEALALASEKVQRAIDGAPVRKVIVVPDRLVNIVARASTRASPRPSRCLPASPAAGCSRRALAEAVAPSREVLRPSMARRARARPAGWCAMLYAIGWRRAGPQPIPATASMCCSMTIWKVSACLPTRPLAASGVRCARATSSS